MCGHTLPHNKLWFTPLQILGSYSYLQGRKYFSWSFLSQERQCLTNGEHSSSTVSASAGLPARWQGEGPAYLNWQKISAYSGRIPLACSTVTRKVKALPSFRWWPISSEKPSITIFPSSKVPDFKSKEGQMNIHRVQITYRPPFKEERVGYSFHSEWKKVTISLDSGQYFSLFENVPNHSKLCLHTQVIHSMDFFWRSDDLWTLTLTFHNPQLFQRQTRTSHCNWWKVTLQTRPEEVDDKVA